MASDYFYQEKSVLSPVLSFLSYYKTNVVMIMSIC